MSQVGEIEHLLEEAHALDDHRNCQEGSCWLASELEEQYEAQKKGLGHTEHYESIRSKFHCNQGKAEAFLLQVVSKDCLGVILWFRLPVP